METVSAVPVFLLFACVAGLAVALFAIAALFNPRQYVGPVQKMPYESGMDPIHDTRRRFDVRFHLIAIAFLVFDVEVLFLYPWAVIAYSEGGGPTWKSVFGRVVFVEILVFLATLAIGYVYAWRKGVFQWR